MKDRRPSIVGERSLRADAGLAALGVLLLLLNVPGSPFRDSQLELDATLGIPICIGVAAYRGFGEGAALWELLAVAVWGAAWVLLGVFVGFFLTMESSGPYPGVWVELARDLVRFEVLAAAFGVPMGSPATSGATTAWRR